MVSLTIFDSVYDNKTHKRIDYKTFEDFEKILYKLSEATKYKKKTEAPLISPAIYLPKTTRANDNVTHWAGFGIVDVDDYEGDIKDIHEKYAQYQYVCYSTASSTKEKPKFRLVFPLSKFVEKNNIKHFWYALNKEIGDIADAQTKDLSRMYYVPANYPDAYNFIFTHQGEVMDPDVLMSNHRYIVQSDSFFDRLPKSIQMGLIEHRKNLLNNTDVSWVGYADCPFVNKKQVSDYKLITGGGWYYKMYQIMVSTAGSAVARGYPITAKEIEWICKDLDNDTGGWYGKRDMAKEADRAIDYVFKNNM